MNWPYSTYSKINPIAEENFPFKKARDEQLETISEIIEAIDKGYKYIVLEAGTGTGKSAIAATLASIYESSYILTITKQLQDQYVKDFKDFERVKGRNNFLCRKYAEDKIEEYCDFGRCKLEKYNCEYNINPFKRADLKKENICYYQKQKADALHAKTVITNYDYIFHELNHLNDFQHRELMIFDEAHNLENKIMNLLTLEFTRKELKEEVKINLSKETVKTLNNGTVKEWVFFISKIQNKYNDEILKLKEVPKSKQNQDYFLKLDLLNRRFDDFADFIMYIQEDPDNWIFDYDKTKAKARFRPIKIDKYAKEVLLKYGDICLFMSATILDYELFAKWLGIDKDKIYPIRRKTPFDVRRNPVLTYKNLPMTYRKLNKNAPRTIPIIKEILEKHKNQKGLIHTVSYQCKEFLKKELNNERLIDHENYNREDKLTEFIKSQEPNVLISPSMNEGVDLPGKQCRFQIMYKIPYPSCGDKQTKIRKNKEPKWYAYQTVLSLLQTYGRGMRSEDDFCTTYFLDSRLKRFIKDDETRNNFIPDYFKESIDADPLNLKEPNETIPLKEKREGIIKYIKKELKNDGYQKFRTIADEMKKNPNFKDKRKLTRASEEDFLDIPITEIIENKYALKKEGKALEREDYAKACEFYEKLKTNPLFKNDYYPYRRLCILHNRNSNYLEDFKTITDFLNQKIYCNEHQLIWFENKIKYLEDKVDQRVVSIEKINNLLQNFKNNRFSYKINENEPTHICERIVKDTKSNIRILSNEKFQKNENIYAITEKGMGLERIKEYDQAIFYYYKLLNNELDYLRYFAYYRLSMIGKRLN